LSSRKHEVFTYADIATKRNKLQHLIAQREHYSFKPTNKQIGLLPEPESEKSARLKCAGKQVPLILD